MRKFLFLSLIILSSNIYADIIKVTILGSGTPRVNIDRFSQSILVEHKNDKFLFDAGRGALLRLNQSRILPNEINNIFFTHLHSDHVLGFPDILMTGWVYHRQKPLNVFGPPGTINFVDSTIKSFEEDINIIKIRSIIMVERSSQKGIIIGHKGEAIKKVGTESRIDMEAFFNKKIFLDLQVKVNKNWRSSDKQLKRFGYNQK